MITESWWTLTSYRQSSGHFVRSGIFPMLKRLLRRHLLKRISGLIHCGKRKNSLAGCIESWSIPQFLGSDDANAPCLLTRLPASPGVANCLSGTTAQKPQRLTICLNGKSRKICCEGQLLRFLQHIVISSGCSITMIAPTKILQPA